MRKLVFLLALLLNPGHSLGQATTHSAIISWPAPADASATTTYDIWRISSPCPGQPGYLLIGWTRIATGITALTYTDSNLKVGTYCWAATQTQGTYPASVRSDFSNLITGTVTPQALTISIKPGS